MVHGRVQSEKAGIDGIIDVGVVVIAHFENPARVHAFAFLKNVSLWKKKCLIPTSAIMGAYHVMTEYIGVDMAIDALETALTHKIESWDGHLVYKTVCVVGLRGFSFSKCFYD